MDKYEKRPVLAPGVFRFRCICQADLKPTQKEAGLAPGFGCCRP